MAATVVIPARYGSTRFPAKILASSTGRPLVQHVVDQALKCQRVGRVLVATDDERIAGALKPFGTEVVMTSPDHQSGTDRIAEVARGGLTDPIIVNVQGDEPEIEPAIIDGLIRLLEDPPADGGPTDMATAATRFPAGADVNDPNLVKVVAGVGGRALYFSRSPIPFRREPTSLGHPAYYLHLGIYAYRREFLLRFASWAPTALEQTEKLEQLRVLEHGGTIRVLAVERATHGIDTAEQYEAFVARWKLRASGT
ncbi:MAG TPA: 3-deoxy-manno-octulosonate cytidylyltransferase [Tepidisphaeraceae bacterium]|nr:3-deoxy-manno-octulosonate cytidylyltransferase [Tepidisphaeraceae bacterium]